MASQKPLSPRKLPRHPRARATVDALVEAAADILVREGWPAFTTNAVAERAGVNIASLYQYFPNKESLVAELQRRHRLRWAEQLPKVTTALGAKPSPRRALEALVELAIAEHRVSPALHRVFTEELPRALRERDGASPAARQWEASLRRQMKNVPEPALALFMARAAVHGAVHDAANERPADLGRALFKAELVELVLRFVDRPRR